MKKLARIQEARRNGIQGELLAKVLLEAKFGTVIDTRNTKIDYLVDGKPVEVKACKKEAGGRAGRYSIQKEQLDMLHAAKGYFVFIVIDGDEAKSKLVKASKVQYKGDFERFTLCWKNIF